MAKGNITGFFEASAANPELAGKVAALASEYGYEFTAEEWSNSAGNIAAKIIRGGTYVRLKTDLSPMKKQNAYSEEPLVSANGDSSLEEKVPLSDGKMYRVTGGISPFRTR